MKELFVYCEQQMLLLKQELGRENPELLSYFKQR